MIQLVALKASSTDMFVRERYHKGVGNCTVLGLRERIERMRGASALSLHQSPKHFGVTLIAESVETDHKPHRCGSKK